MGPKELSDSENVCWRNKKSHGGASKMSPWVNCSLTSGDSSVCVCLSSGFRKVGLTSKSSGCQKRRKAMIVTTGTSKARKIKPFNHSKAPRKWHDWGQRLGVHHISLSKEIVKPVPGPQAAAAAAAKSLRSCPTLCDPRDGSPPGSSAPGLPRQEHWSGLPFPSPMHESEKWKWGRSALSDS